MAVMGGEGSRINSNFLDAYSKISGEGRSAEEQIAAIRGSVDNKLVNAQEQVDPTGSFKEKSQTKGQRELTGIDKIAGDISAASNELASSVGNFFFGEEAEEDSFLEKSGRFVANAPLGVVAALPGGIARATAANTSGTDLTYYDPETSTVPDDERGKLTNTGKLATTASAGLDVLTMGKGAGLVGRAGAGAIKGGTRAAAKGISSKFGNGAAKEGETVGQAALSGWQGGLAKSSTKEKTGFGKTVQNLENKWESFGQKGAGHRALTTAGEEAVQETIQGSLDWVSSNDEKIDRGELTAEDWANLGENTLWSAYGGALGGGVLGGAGGLLEQRSMKKSARAAEAAIKSDVLDTTSKDSALTGSNPGRFKNVPGYDHVSAETEQAWIKESKPEKISGASTTVSTRDGLGVNSFEAGRNTISAIYTLENGKEFIDAKLGEAAAALSVNLNDVLLAPQLYDNGTEQGEEAAINDFNKVLDVAGGAEGLVWKDPANGYQMKLTLRRMIKDNQLRVNQAIAGLFNGDFDTDALGFTLDPEVIGKALIPTQLLMSNAVDGKVNLKLDYVAFGDFASAGVSTGEIVDAIMAGDKTISKKQATQIAKDFEKKYKDAGDGLDANERRAAVISEFFSNDGAAIAASNAEALFGKFQIQGKKVDKAIAESKNIVLEEISRSVKEVTDQTGAVPSDTAPTELMVRIGRIEPHRTGKPLRMAASWLFQTAKDLGADFFTTPAALQHAMRFQNITATGEKPQEVLKMAFRDSVRAELRMIMTKLPDGKFTRSEDFDLFKDLVNRQRPQLEQAVEYYELDGKHFFDGFLGTSAQIHDQNGAIKAFIQTCGDLRFDDFFVLPDTSDSGLWVGASIEHVFKEVAARHNGAVGVFSHYSAAYEQMWINGIKSTYKASAIKQYEKLYEGAVEATSKKLHPGKDGIIPIDEMYSFTMRWDFVTTALRQRVVSLQLSDIASLDQYAGFYDNGLTTDNPDTLLRMMASLSVIDECRDLMISVEAYNAEPTSALKENLRTEALRQMQLLSPPYQMIAADIMDQLDAGAEVVDSGTYKMLSTLHESPDVELSTFQKLLEGVYGAREDLGTSYGNLLVDLMVTSSDEIALGQLGEDFTRARTYARKASLSNQELAELRYNEVIEAAQLLGDPPQYFVDIVEEMTKEPVLWEDEVMSEALRTPGFPSNATKEKARAERYSRIVHGGLATKHGGYGTEESRMFLDSVFKTDAESFFSDSRIISDYLFGPQDITYELITKTGQTKIITKKDFFEWATGNKYSVKPEDQNRQIFEALSKRKMLLSNLLPQTITVSIKESVQARSKEEAVRFYKKRRGARNERFVQDRNLRMIKSRMQEDPNIIKFVYGKMSELNNGQSLPFTNRRQFFDLYSTAMKELARAIYYNATITSDAVTAQENGTKAKTMSFHKAITDLGERLKNLNQARLLDRENAASINTIMDQSILDSATSMATQILLGADTDVFIKSGGSYDVGVYQIEEDIEIAAKVESLMNQATLVAMSRYNADNVVSSSGIRTNIKNQIKGMTTAALEGYAKKHGSFIEQDGSVNVDAARAFLLGEVDTKYSDEELQYVIDSGFKVDQNAASINKMPNTLEEMMASKNPEEYFKDYNPEVGEGVDQTTMFAKVLELGNKATAIKAGEAARIKTRVDPILQKKGNAKLALVKKPGAINPDGSFSDAVIQQGQEIDRLTDIEIAEATNAEIASTANKLEGLQIEYSELVEKKKAFEYYSLMVEVQRIGDPLNTKVLADLDTMNDQFLKLCDSYRDAMFIDKDLRNLEYIPAGARQGEVFIPQFSTLDLTAKAAIAGAEASIQSGDVELGTALGATGSGRRSIYPELGNSKVCSAHGSQMKYSEAVNLKDAVSMRINTSEGQRVVPAPNGQLGLINSINRIVADPDVIVYSKNECTCPGCCANHDMSPVYNPLTANNSMATFFSQLAYYMEEVEQLQKKKTLSSSKAAKALFPEIEENLALRPLEIPVTDLDLTMAKCEEYTDELARVYKIRMDEAINRMEDNAQSKLLDADFFSKQIAEFCTRFVQLNVYLSDGTVMSEYALKNGDVAGRVAELTALDGVSDIKLIPISVSPQQSELAAIRYRNSKETRSTDDLMDGLQNTGAKIEQDSEGNFKYTDTVTHKPGQVDLDSFYNLSDILHPGKSEMPFGPDEKLPWMTYIAQDIGQGNYMDNKPNGDGLIPNNDPSFLQNKRDEMELSSLADVVAGAEGFFLVNKDTENSNGKSDDFVRRSSFVPVLGRDKGDVIFGTSARAIRPPDNKKAMVYLLNPSASKIDAYCKWAERVPQKTYVFIPSASAEALSDSNYSGYTFEMNGNYVVVIDPMETMRNQSTSGFRAQTIEKKKDFFPIIESDRPDIGDGVVQLPTSFKGTESTIIRNGRFKIKDLMKDRIGQATIVDKESQDLVISTQRQATTSRFVQIPDSWDKWSTASVNAAFKKYSLTELNDQGMALDCIDGNDIACVIALPPFKGDLTGTITYYPLTVAEIGLGSSVDVINASLSSDGSGFDFTGFTDIEWDEDTIRKYLGNESAAKATAILASQYLSFGANGLEVAEMKAADLVTKTLETTATKIKKFVNFYQVVREIGGRLVSRSMWIEPDQQGGPKNREDVNANLFANDKFLSSYEDTSPYEMILNGHNYKKEEFLNVEAEAVLKTFLRNCKTLGASPGKILSPMIIEDGKLAYKVFDDEAMALYFTNISQNQAFLMFNYISNGEYCPPNTMTMEGDYAINYNYKMRMQPVNGKSEYKFFTLSDGTFNAENVSIVDATSDSVTNGMQQSVRKLAYSPASVYDQTSIANKQNLDAADYEKLRITNEERLEKIIKRNEKGLPPAPPIAKGMKTIAQCLDQSVGLVTDSRFVQNMNEAFEAIEKAYTHPAGIHILDDNGVKVPVAENGKEWDILERTFMKAGGFTGDKGWSRDQLKRFISNYMSYTAQDNGIDSFSFTEVRQALVEYGELLNNKETTFPRKEIVSQSDDAKTIRMGSCGHLGMLEAEWSIPKVKARFNNNWNDYLTAAGEYQRSQSTKYPGILNGSDQKIRMYHYLQIYLQSELNDIVPRGVGTVDMFDWNLHADADANDILRMFGIEPTNAAVLEAMKAYSQESYQRLMNQEARDRGGNSIRRAAKLDKNGEPLPRRAGHEQTRSTVGDIFNMIYSLRVANGLFLNPALIGANVMQTVVNGKAQGFANRASFFLGEKGLKDLGVQPREMQLVSDASQDSLITMFFKLEQMTAFYNDPTLLNGFFDDPDGTMERLNQTLSKGPFAKRWIRKYARFSANLATGFGVGSKSLSENYLFRFGQYMGDFNWLSEHYLQDGKRMEFTEPIMTQTEWESILSSEVTLRKFMSDAAAPGHPLNAIHNAAVQDSLKIVWARKTIVTELLSSVLTSLGKSRFFPMSKATAEGIVAIGVTPFLKYYTNFAMFAATAIQGVPCETMLHIAHHKGLDLKQWLTANNVSADIITRIDFEAMSSSRSLKEAMIRDAIKFGGIQFLGLVAAGMLQLVEPEKEELKDNFEEYAIGNILTDDGEPFRVKMLWPLQDLLGPFGPVAVYWSTVLNGNPRPGLLANGFTDLMANNATMTANNLAEFINDPLMWQRETDDDQMGKMNGANLAETDPAISSGNKFFMQGVLALYRVIVPNSLDSFLNGVPGTEKEVSSNYIYEEDDSGKPTGRINPETGQAYLEKTSEADAAWRRIAKKHPVLGYILDIQNNISGKGGTGYTRQEMPNIVRYSPFQMASAEMYQITGDVEHDDQVAADVIAMLASFDDLDELMETGFYVNSETRFYVGQKVWDAYYGVQEQIDQAYALGLNDYYALGNGDYLEGQKIWSTWNQSMQAQKQFYYDFYYDKVNAEQLRTRMETANVMRQSYDKDSNGEWYATGFANDNPWALLSFGSRYGNAGAEGGWSSVDPLTNLPVGERGWIWNSANSYYDSMKFEEYSNRGDGKGYSAVHVDGTGDAFSDLSSLEAMFNPNAVKGSYSKGSYGKSGGGGGGGGGSYMPKLYSNPQDLNADRPTIARMGRLYDSQMDYIRPDWETKGSNKASRRSDI